MRISVITMFAACTMLLSCGQPSSVQVHGGVASSFRHPRKDQLCQVVKVFTAPSDDAFFGRIGSFYPQYYDPVVHKTIPSFNVRATISGELVTVWRPADDMLRLYIDERDPELKQCVPDIEPDPYTPGDWEVPSSAPIPTRAPHPR